MGIAISAEIGKNSGTFLANEDPVAVFKGGFIHAGSFGGIDERSVGRAAIDENDFVVERNDPGVLFGNGIVGYDHVVFRRVATDLETGFRNGETTAGESTGGDVNRSEIDWRSLGRNEGWRWERIDWDGPTLVLVRPL